MVNKFIFAAFFLRAGIVPASSSETISLVNMYANIVLSVVITFLAIFLSIVLRRFVIRRLRKTILDNWMVQSFGILIFLPMLALGALVMLGVWNTNLLVSFWEAITKEQFQQAGAIAWNLALTAIIMFLGIGLARTLMRATIRGMGESRFDLGIRTLVGRLIFIGIVIVLIFWVLSIWQVGLTLPVTVLSAMAVAFTVSIQDLLKDLVAGIYLLMERPFVIGDNIRINYPVAFVYEGKVEDIRMRATKMRLVTGEEILIPNTIIFVNTVTNHSFYGERRAAISMTLAEEHFQEELTTQKVIEKIVSIDTVISKPEPTVIFSTFQEGKVTLTIRFWVASGQLSAINDVMYSLHILIPEAELAVKEPVSQV